MAFIYYQKGQAITTYASIHVYGSGTCWMTDPEVVPLAGCKFTTDGTNFYEIEEIVSDTELILKIPYEQESSEGTTYAILPFDVEDPEPSQQTEFLSMLAAAEEYMDQTADLLAQAQNISDHLGDDMDQTICELVARVDALEAELAARPTFADIDAAVAAAIGNVMAGYATEDYVDNAVPDVSIFATQTDISDFQTQTEINDAISVAMSNCVTLVELNDYVKFTDLSVYATMADVNTAIAAIDYSDFVTTSTLADYCTIDTMIAAIAAIDYSDFVTTTMIANYSTTAEMNAAIAALPVVTVSTLDPSGGVDGDVWIKVD